MKRLLLIFFVGLPLCLPVGRAQNSTPSAGGLALPTVQIQPPPAATADSPAANAPAAAADPAKAFADGVTAYGQGQFDKARDLFAAAETAAISPALEYNFGNACYQTRDYAGAILHYLRALALDPRDPDTQKNLALARQAAGLVLAEPSRLDRFAALLTLNGWTWMVTVFGWMTLYLALLPRLFRWRGALPVLSCILAAVITLAGVAGSCAANRHRHDGVILKPDTPLKFSPTATSQPTSIAQAGEIARTLRKYNGYFEVRTPDGRTGWVDNAGYAPVVR